MAGDGKQKIVIVGGQFREFVFQHLRGSRCALAFLGYHCLNGLREQLVWQLTQPCFEH